MTHPRNAAVEYARLNLQTGIESATPYRLIQMLLAGAIEKLGNARRAMEAGDVAAKGANISWAISIIDGLRASLDLERGGEIAANLDNLYDYATRAAVEANLDDDAEGLRGIVAVLEQIQSAWNEIEPQVEQPGTVRENRTLGNRAVAVG